MWDINKMKNTYHQHITCTDVQQGLLFLKYDSLASVAFYT